ncbi:cupin domain-containing protein [Flavobacterium zepuense]|uniref:Cupin domain-containing protein n=1 Tax=Flavobacterium zepuense TaxID=2593302 RepID=A0A552UZM9_9FLAO|nr:cupin domain-containing protein [Flavobacterium zepuense]TRW23678.1 cupin domain-containing protein [Flavobacterium zepuense]
MENTEQSSTPPQGFGPVAAQYFTGTAWLQMRVTPDEITNCAIGEVIFEPGCRNNWHTHPSNQILIVTEGIGYYQEEGSSIREIKVGDIVNVLPGIKHWHGASPESRFTHYAVSINTEKGIVDWLEPVTDEQYHSFE